MRYKLLCILIVACNFTSKTNAQKSQIDSISFSGQISYGYDRYKSVLFSYNKEDYIDLSNGIYHQLVLDSSGKFYVKVPDLKKPYKIYLSARSQEGNLFDKNYFAEPQDSINARINYWPNTDIIRGKIIFSGRGSEKYNLIEEIERQFWDDYYGELEVLDLGLGVVTDSSELKSKIDGLVKMLLNYKNKKEILIKNSSISSDVKALINYEYGRYMEEWDFRMQNFYLKNPEQRKEIMQKYKQYAKVFFDPPSDLGVYCNRYLLAVSFRILFTIQTSTNDYTTGVDVLNFYNYIKANFQGKLGDRLLTESLLNPGVKMNFSPSKSFTIDSLLSDAIKTVNSPYLKTALKKEVSRIGKITGRKVTNGEFTGLDGKKRNLNSLKGKVVLLDVWFNGCSGCVLFHNTFKTEVFPKFKNNPDFVVLSVNTDKSRERWISGIASKSYTSDDYINVTTGTWFEHPFFKYYNVVGAPFLMLIDRDGAIRYQPNGTSVDTLVENINAALQDK